MTNQEILKIAMAQSTVDLCAEPTDFEKSENVVVISRESDGAGRYRDDAQVGRTDETARL